MRLFHRIKNHPGVGVDIKEGLLSMLLRVSAEENPRFVLRVLRETPELVSGDRDSMGRDAVEIAMRSWAKVDPYAALDWIRRLKDRPDLATPAVKAALVAGAGSVDVARGFRMLEELGDYDNDAVGSLAQEANTAEQRTAVLTEMRKLAATLEPSMERTRLENRITITLLDKAVREGFGNGSRWISDAGFSKQSLGNGPAFDYRNMKGEEVGDWMGWIGVQFQPDAGRVTISNLMASWTKADYLSASNWLRGADPGPTRDAAFAAFLTSVTESSPDEARKWAMDLPDAAERERAMDLIGKVASRGAGK
ncbi:MAG: hypothetical protein KF712_21210 [Akkermansiaceae bacterium]|nr:hypothetical protein [Akkermansiaceae bacterium]